MSTDPTIYIGPYVELTIDGTMRHIDEIFDGHEPFMDCTDYLTCKPADNIRILVPNVDRGAPRQFWINPNDFAGFETLDDVKIRAEIEFLANAFKAEFDKLKAETPGPKDGWVKWGYFIWEM